MSINDNMLRLSTYKVIGELPNPFKFNDGTEVRTKEDWNRRRTEMLDAAVDMQFGVFPPAPDYFDVELLFKGKEQSSYKVTAGTKKRQVSFLMKVMLPSETGKCPVIINGDLCANYHMQPGYVDAALSKGIGWVFFDRTELAHDVQGEGRGRGALYKVYFEHDFGAIAAWAWGYSRCVDTLHQIHDQSIDLNWISATGHSRGGKVAILAGAVDERIRVVNPNEACLGGGGCYRIYSEGDYLDLDRWPSETLNDILKETDFWFGPEMGSYIGRENTLPFDAHYLKALIAPRILFVSEAAGDMWANPVGAWQTTIAAKEVFDYLGVPDNLFWYYRSGTHYHKTIDVQMLVNVILHCRDGVPLIDGYYVTPFCKHEKIFSWKAPIKDSLRDNRRDEG